MKLRMFALLICPVLLAAQSGPKGLIAKDGRPLYPIGSYELPRDDDGLRAMAQAGFNLVRVRNRQDLDRLAAVGLQGWLPVPLHIGAEGGRLRALVDAVKDHPALAIWEGPDEIVWNFTAYSGLTRDGGPLTPNEWWRQTPRAVEYSEQQAAKIMPNLQAGIELVRGLDPRKRQIWINEAARSDLKFMRQYTGAIDVTGCDVYPIHAKTRTPAAVGDYTVRFERSGQGLPVWMVLQGFAWGELKGRDEPVTYPTFAETRMMAWSAIARGARGVLYWGMDAAPPQPAFRESLYAMAGELAALQPFLTAPDVSGVRVEALDSEDFDTPSRGIALLCRKAGPDCLLALVNPDSRPHMGVVVGGLRAVERLELLYGAETAVVKRGEFVTRLLPLEVKVFASSRRWESARRAGRDFVKP